MNRKRSEGPRGNIAYFQVTTYANPAIDKELYASMLEVTLFLSRDNGEFARDIIDLSCSRLSINQPIFVRRNNAPDTVGTRVIKIRRDAIRRQPRFL